MKKGKKVLEIIKLYIKKSTELKIHEKTKKSSGITSPPEVRSMLKKKTIGTSYSKTFCPKYLDARNSILSLSEMPLTTLAF